MVDPLSDTRKVTEKLVEEAEAGGALYTFLGALVVVGFLAIRAIY